MGLKLVHSVRTLPPLPEPSVEDVAVLQPGPEPEGPPPEEPGARELDGLIDRSRALEADVPAQTAARLVERRERLERVRAIADQHRRRALGALRLPELLGEAHQVLDDGLAVLRWALEGEPLDEEVVARVTARVPEDPRARLLRRAHDQLAAAESEARRAHELEQWIRGEREVLVLDGTIGLDRHEEDEG